LQYVSEQFQSTGGNIIIKSNGIYIPASPAAIVLLCGEQIAQTFFRGGSVFLFLG
jgi:hypothetical protein